MPFVIADGFSADDPPRSADDPRKATDDPRKAVDDSRSPTMIDGWQPMTH